MVLMILDEQINIYVERREREVLIWVFVVHLRVNNKNIEQVKSSCLEKMFIIIIINIIIITILINVIIIIIINTADRLKCQLIVQYSFFSFYIHATTFKYPQFKLFPSLSLTFL